jgi:hypothetical protein
MGNPNRLLAELKRRRSTDVTVRDYVRQLVTMAVATTALLMAAHVVAAENFVPQLTAFELSSDQVHPGEMLLASYEFVNTGTTPASGECHVFVHVRPAAPGDPDVPPAAGDDFLPATPTFVWRPRGVVRQREQRIKIPKDFPPGRYRLLIGIFDPNNGQRYRLANDDLAASGHRYRLAEFAVLPKEKPLAGKPIAVRWRDTTGLPDAEEDAAWRPDEKAIQLDSGSLRVVLSAIRPVVLGYELRGGQGLSGDLSGYPLRARIDRVDGGKSIMVCLTDPASFSLRQHGAEARYSVHVRQQETVAARFDLVFRLQGNVLRVGVENVREEAGFLLMDVFLPQLAGTRGPAGQLVMPTQGGRLIPLGQSAPGRHTIGMNWFEMDLCGAVVGKGCAAAIRTRDWDNELEVRVAGASGKLYGGYAVRLALRADAEAKAAKIRLAQCPSVQVAILENAGAGPVTWVDVAKWLRRDVKGSPNRLYQDTFLYKVFCDSPGAKDYTTFDEALGVIRKVHELAPWLKQVVYLVGWQYRGHDSGYPATDQINSRLGGIEGLRRLSAAAAKYNAILSYHDNFDDAYRDSPRWDASLIARDRYGELRKGGVWAGGQSYILAFKKYAEKAGVARVQRTVGQMPVRDSYHIDVLSAVPLRRDYNPLAPESTQDSLEGKCAIIREFNRLGVDVTSEGFTAPFVGIIGHAWHFWCSHEPQFVGEEPIPFIAMVYHGGPTTYGHGGQPTPMFRQESVLCGASYSTDWGKHTNSHAMAEALYLIVAPWTYLRDRQMQDYQRHGDHCRVSYGADSYVEVNRSNGQWRVVVDGAAIVENDLAVVPKGNLLAVYARTARQAKVKLPVEMAGQDLQITNACTGEDLTGRAEVAGGVVTLDLPAGEPLLIRATRGEARHER